MSLKYRDSSGTETPVAGLNGTSGELVPSVALYQTGSFTVPVLPADGYITSDVISLQTPFPDTDYIITFDFGNSSLIAGAIYKSASSFRAVIGNVDPVGGTGASTCYWKAYKLMTDTVHEADSAHIAQNTANFAPAFSTTTSYAVGDYVTYNNVLYRCTTAHTAGVWVAGHFTQVTVGERLKPLEAVVPTAGVGTGINRQDIVSGAANTSINIPAYHFCSGLMYLQIAGTGTALLSYETDYVRNLNMKVIAGIGITLTGLALYKGETLLGTFSMSGDYIVFAATAATTIRTDYTAL